MDQQIKSVWLDKLRSGTVAQAHQVLEDLDNDSKCCLGVLMQCQGKSPYDWASEQAQNAEDEHYDDPVHFLQTAELPHSYAAGLTEDEMGLLAALNDGTMIGLHQDSAFRRTMADHGFTDKDISHAWSFAEIADYIGEWL